MVWWRDIRSISSHILWFCTLRGIVVQALVLHPNSMSFFADGKISRFAWTSCISCREWAKDAALSFWMDGAEEACRVYTGPSWYLSVSLVPRPTSARHFIRAEKWVWGLSAKSLVFDCAISHVFCVTFLADLKLDCVVSEAEMSAESDKCFFCPDVTRKGQRHCRFPPS